MHYVLLLSLLASGLLGLPFGAAAPLPSSNTLSLKERNSKPLDLEQEFSSPTSSPTPSTTALSPSFKRGLLFPPSVVSSIATSPITPEVGKKRQEHLPTEASPRMAKRSEDALPLTKRQPKGSATEERSPTTPGEEPRGLSALGSRSADGDNVDSASAAGIKMARKDPDWNEEKKCWAPKHSPLFYGFIGACSAVAFWAVIQFGYFLLGLPHSLKYFKVYWEYRQAKTKITIDQMRAFKQTVLELGTGGGQKET